MCNEENNRERGGAKASELTQKFADLLGNAVERTSQNSSYNKDSGALLDFVAKVGLTDTREKRGEFDIERDYTYRHYDGSKSRLDYQLTTKAEAITVTKTINFDRIATNHRMIVSSFNLFLLVGGWKSVTQPVKYPTPIRVNETDEEKESAFKKKEEEWFQKLDKELYCMIVDNEAKNDVEIEAKQNGFLAELQILCVEEAEKIWGANNRELKHKRSKVKGILLGMLQRHASQNTGKSTKTKGG